MTVMTKTIMMMTINPMRAPITITNVFVPVVEASGRAVVINEEFVSVLSVVAVVALDIDAEVLPEVLVVCVVGEVVLLVVVEVVVLVVVLVVVELVVV